MANAGDQQLSPIGERPVIDDVLAGFALVSVGGCWLWLALTALVFPMVMLDDSGRAAANVNRVGHIIAVGVPLAIAASVLTAVGYRRRRRVLLATAIGCLVVLSAVGVISFPHAR